MINFEEIRDIMEAAREEHFAPLLYTTFFFPFKKISLLI